MIKSYEDYKMYLAQDLERYHRSMPNLKDWLVMNEFWYIFKYTKLLRKLEYYKNTGKSRLMYYYYFLKYKRLGTKINVKIPVNCIGPGFRIVHLGPLIRLNEKAVVGANCTLQSGVIIGNKHDDDLFGAKIGDDCYFGTGCKILGGVLIGDHVTIGANAVVVKDIPNNAIVGGVPANIIKIKMD